ncbi:hypothetical protein D3C75_837550 [compost metagenome]
MLDHADRSPAIDAGQTLAQGLDRSGLDQVGLAQQQAIGKADLGLGDGLGQVQLGVGGIDQGDDAVEDVALTQLFVDEEGLGHRRRVGQAGAFDYQAVEGDLAGIQAFEQQVQGAGQVAMDAAAHAAIGQGHHLNRLVAQQLAVDAGLAEFVFDHGDLQAVLGLEHVLEQGGLAGTEEASEYGYGNRRLHAEHLLCGKNTGLIAGKPAPTGTAQTLRPVEYLWEPACRR